MSHPQSSTFVNRLRRIERNEGNTNASLHIGADEVLHGAAYLSVHRLRGKQRVTQFAQMPFAYVCGAAAPFIGHWVRLNLGLSTQGLHNLMLDFLFSVGIILCLWVASGMYGRFPKLALILGATVSSILFAQWVALWPNFYAVMFSPAWVEMVVSSGLPM